MSPKFKMMFIAMVIFATFAVAKDKVKSALELKCEAKYGTKDLQADCLKAQAEELKKRSDKLEEEVIKNSPPSMKQRYKERKNQEKEKEKTKNLVEEIRELAHVSGCDATKMFISGNAEESDRWNVTASIRVKNTSMGYAEISTPKLGPIVTNLCPGAEISLSFSNQWGDSNTKSIPIKISVRWSDGSYAEDEYRVTLNKLDSQYERVKEINWSPSLQKRTLYR